jgi:hypothetical protein
MMHVGLDSCKEFFAVHAFLSLIQLLFRRLGFLIILHVIRVPGLYFSWTFLLTPLISCRVGCLLWKHTFNCKVQLT